MSQKTKIIITAAVALVLLVLVIFFFGFRETETAGEPRGFFGGLFPKPAEVTPAPTAQEVPPIRIEDIATILAPGQNTATIPRWTLIALGNDPARSIGVTKNAVRYHKNTPENLGHLFERTKEALGDEARISNLLLQQIEEIQWSPDGNTALVSYRDEELNVRSFLVFYKGTTTPKTRFIENDIKTLAFSPDSKSIAYTLKNNDSYDVFTATTDFRNQRRVLSNNIPSFEISWPTANMLALKTKSSYEIASFLYNIPTAGGILNRIFGGRGLDAVWNRAGMHVVLSRVNSNGRPLALTLLGVSTGEQATLPFTTLAEKCVFGKENPNMLYCGVPKFIPAGHFPDEWWQGKVALQDTIIAYDLREKKQIASVNTLSDVVNQEIFDDDSYLFFQDKNTEKLWAVKLK